MDFKDKKGKTRNCKMSCISVKLCEFPTKELTLVAVYGFGYEPMLLLSNLKMQEKKRLCHIVAKVYLMRWRIEEYFKFKKQQFELEDLRVMSLQSICNLNLLTTLAAGYIALTSTVHRESIFLSMSRNGISCFFPKKAKSQQLNLFEYFKIEDSGALVF